MAEEHEMTSEDLFTQEMKLAALKAYADVNGTCRPVAMTAALNAALAVMPKQPVDKLEAENKQLKRDAEVRDMVITRTENQWVGWEARATAAEARVKVLEDALEAQAKQHEMLHVMAGKDRISIVNPNGSLRRVSLRTVVEMECNIAAKAARAALKGGK